MSVAGAKSPASAAPTSPLPVAPPAHRKFTLHRQIWEMRKAEIKKREMTTKAKEVGRGLPQVPHGRF